MRLVHASTAPLSFAVRRTGACNALHGWREIAPGERNMRGEWSATTSRTVDLGYDQLLVLQSEPGTRVRVLYGHLWLTEEGGGQDVFASSGAELALKARGRTVIEGLDRARVEIIEPAGSVRPSWHGLSARWQRWLGGLRELPRAALRPWHA
jgi:hypothetical protein